MYYNIPFIKTLITCLVILDCSYYAVAQSFEWAAGWGSAAPPGMWVAADEQAKGIARDKNGNIYTIGTFTFPTDFDPGPDTFMMYPVGNHDAFVSKLDANGNFIWARRMGGTYFDPTYRTPSDAGVAIATDTFGNVYVTGVYKETADFGSFTLTSNGGKDIFISKLDSNGNFLWAKSIGAGSVRIHPDESVNGMALDDFSNIYLTGHFRDTTDFDPGTGVYNLIPKAVNLPFGNSADMFVLKLDSDGNFVWAGNMGGAYTTVGTDINVDKYGNVYAMGQFGHGTRTTDFDPGVGVYNLTATTGDHFFMLQLDNAGNFVWANLLDAHLYAYDFAIDTNSFIYIAGNGIITKYTPNGNLIWKKGTGSWNQAITLDEEGNLYIAGGFMGYADFDPDPNSSYRVFASERDIFNLKLDNEGRFIWVATTTGPGMSLGLDLIVDECHNVYSCGEFSLTPDFDPGSGVLLLNSVGHRDAFVLKLSQKESIYITVDTFILGVSKPYTGYQWYLNGAPIPGATDSIYAVTENGDYVVVVTNSKGCVDSTPVYKVTNVYDDEEDPETSLQEVATAAVRIYPNPTRDELYIHSSVSVQVVLSGIEGKELKKVENQGGKSSISLYGYTPGIYLLQIYDQYGRYIKTEKVIKQ